MIEAIYYQGIYLAIVTLFSITCFARYHNTAVAVRDPKFPGIALFLFLYFFIGFRPLSPVFADTMGYAGAHDSYLFREFEFSWDHDNYVFDNLGFWIASIGWDHSIFFLIIALLYFGIRYLSCLKLFPNNSWIAFLIFLGSFITYTSSVNGLKAGVASSFFALAIAYRKKWVKAVIFLAIAWGMHHAFHVCLLAYGVAYFYKNTKVYLVFWCIALLLAIFHISYFQELFSGFTDERGASYLAAGDNGWRTGMRYDFVVYSVAPIIVGWYTIVKQGYQSVEYKFILNLYVLLNSIWMLCMYASFTNRIAALSWLIYPIVISYPFLSSDYNKSQQTKNRLVSTALMLNLGFTLFMSVFYYGLLKS